MTEGYRPDIDGLRAVAVVSVLMFHCGVPGFSGGYAGVDVFFVISGYLITARLIGDIAAGRMSILRFYAGRVRRIVPALAVTLLATWCAAAVIMLPDFLVRTSDALIAASLSVSNIYLWKSANYFAPDAAFQPLLHTWSLSVEEQFYAVVPVAMLVTARTAGPRWRLAFGLLCMASFALSVLATTEAPTANFYLLPTRAWELGVGALLATARLPAFGRSWLNEGLALAGLVLLLVPMAVFGEATAFPGANALYPCVGCALLIQTGRSRTRCAVMLSWKPAAWIGVISYSLYLVHWPVIVFTRYLTLAPLTPLETSCVILGSFGLAAVMWRWVEQPFRRAPFIVPRRMLLGGAGAMAVCCMIGAGGVLAGGFPKRFPGFAEQAIPGHAQWLPGRCFLLGNPDYRLWDAADCTRIATGPRKILLWGDSFAAQYVPGIIANAAALGATVIQYTAAGCPPVLSYRSFARTLCADFNAHALDIVQDEAIDTVVLSGRWTDMQQRGLTEIGSTLAALDGLGVHVILIGQSPIFAEDVQVIAYAKGRGAAGVERWNVAFDEAINAQLAALAGRARFIDPMVLCDGRSCPYEDHGVFLFEDYGHFSAEGSRRAVLRLLVGGTLLSSAD